MKGFWILLILVAVSAQAFGQQISSQTKTNFKKLDWLIGTWHRTNSKPGKSGYEKWELTSTNELRGIGVNLTAKDTTFIEKLRIIIKDDYIAYVADVPENKKLVYFKLTEITDNSFVCENPEHDFPKKIAYQRDGKQLKAQISGNGKVIDYFFERK